MGSGRNEKAVIGEGGLRRVGLRMPWRGGRY